MKKYELTNESITFKGITLYRIRALKDFNSVVRVDDLGGFVQTEYNLSQVGNCWIYDDAVVYGNSTVSDDAEVFDNAEVFNSKIYGNAYVEDSACILESKIFSDANANELYGSARVCGNSKVENSVICDAAQIFGKSEIIRSEISGNVFIRGAFIINSKICDNAEISIETCSKFLSEKHYFSDGSAYIFNSEIYGNAKITAKINCFVGVWNRKIYDNANII